MRFDKALKTWRDGNNRQDVERFWFGPRPRFLVEASTGPLEDSERRELDGFVRAPTNSQTHLQVAKTMAECLTTISRKAVASF